MVEDGEKIKAGKVLVKIPRRSSKSGDITGGLPRITELLEARNPSNPAVVSEIDGVVSFGKIIKEAFIAADELAKEGISCEVIDLRTVRPMDYDAILNSVKKTNRLVVLEEAWPFGSVSSEITYMVQQKAFDYLDAPIKRITTPDAPAPYSAALFAEWFPKLEKVKEEIKKAMYVK